MAQYKTICKRGGSRVITIPHQWDGFPTHSPVRMTLIEKGKAFKVEVMENYTPDESDEDE